ncbi:MAG TPA: LiaF domain-containing protein [Gemmatimonadaceae bacterium]|nr:LiaF domain-containing protein [Gemmatimonadaceae bacterium]
MTGPPPQPPIPSLSNARERKIDELSRHFANDDLSLEDLERRIERVYKSASLAELDSITADLVPMPAAHPAPRSPRDRLAAAAAPSTSVELGYELGRSRLLSIMSSTRRVGRWATPRELDVLAVMSDTRIDLTNAVLPVGGVVDIDISAVMASLQIFVPPGMRVVNQLHSIMSDVRSDADEVGIPGTPPSMPVVRLRGIVFMGNVRVRVRRREETSYDLDDD